MPSIKSLPCEVIAGILGSLDHLDDLASARLACRHLNDSYRAFEMTRQIEAAIVRNQITPALLPHAITLAECRSLIPLYSRAAVEAERQGLDRSTMTTMLDLEPDRLAADVAKLDLRLLRRMSRTHDAIHDYAMGFAHEAWRLVSPGRGRPVLSPTEYFRFCRAFYRLDLFYVLGRGEVVDVPADESRYPLWFFDRYPAWENGQILCAENYLVRQYYQAICDVVPDALAEPHDEVPLPQGHVQVAPEDVYKSQGVEYIRDLSFAKSLDEKRGMVRAARLCGDVAETWWTIDLLYGDAMIVPGSEEEVRNTESVELHHPDEEKVDPGPCEALRITRRPVRPFWGCDECWMRREWLKVRASVLWT